MQRSPQLVPLSHDHHVALEVALVLTRATPETRAAATARFAAHWRERGARHFTDEEAAFTVDLLPGDEVWAGFVQRMTSEHAAIRDLRHALDAGGGGLATVHEAGALLRDHVRFEERTMFPYAEAHLQATALDAIGRAVRHDG